MEELREKHLAWSQFIIPSIHQTSHHLSYPVCASNVLDSAQALEISTLFDHRGRVGEVGWGSFRQDMENEEV